MTETRISFRRHLIEGVTIVLSILIAFGIDAAWGEWNERREERRILVALRDEFARNQEHLESAIRWQSDVRAARLQLAEQAARPTPSLSADSVDYLIAIATSWNTAANFEFAASDAAIQGGRLSVISSEQLRQSLADWSRDLAFVVSVETKDYDSYSSVWMPVLEEFGFLPQISNARTDQPGDIPDYGAELPVGNANVDHRWLLASRRFQNAITRRIWIQDDILHWYEELQPAIARMISLLEAELGM